MISFRELFSKNPTALSFVSTFDDGEKIVDTIEKSSDGIYVEKNCKNISGDIDYWSERLKTFSGLMAVFYSESPGYPAVVHGYHRFHQITTPLDSGSFLNESNGVYFPIYPFYAVDAAGYDAWRTCLSHSPDAEENSN